MAIGNWFSSIALLKTLLFNFAFVSPLPGLALSRALPSAYALG
jgi:hypothetical protein